MPTISFHVSAVHDVSETSLVAPIVLAMRYWNRVKQLLVHMMEWYLLHMMESYILSRPRKPAFEQCAGIIIYTCRHGGPFGLAQI